jgi:hypothetical protein
VSAFHVGINASGNDKKLIISSNTGILTSNLDYADGTWHHVGIGRSGTTLSLYRDGVLDAFVTNNVSYNSGVKNNSYFGIYGDTSLDKGRFEGKLLGMRVINGECVHTSSYTLPTGTATLISDGGTGTNSLGNVAYFQKLNNPIAPINSHMIVSQGQGLNTAVGTPTIVSGVTKTGVTSSSSLPLNSNSNTSAMSFALGNFATLPTSTLKMNGDWTIEFWMNTTASNKDGWGRMIMHTGTLANGENKGMLFAINTNVLDVGMRSASNGAGNVTWINLITVPFTTINTWIHVALCKKNTDITLFLNGQRGGSATFNEPDPGSFFTILPTMRLGSWDISSTQGRYNGLLYNLRIIDGRALYDGATYVVPRPDSISATVDTALLYNDARLDTFYADSLDKAVIGGYLSGTDVITQSVSSSLSYYNLNNISIQNNGIFTTPPNTNTMFNVINNGLKIGSGGKFILSSAPGFKKIINMDNTKIQVLPGGSFEVYGQPKTKSVSLTGFYASNLSAFAFDTTPSNWSANDSLIFLPTSAGVTEFEELCARTVTTNRLSTFTRSSFNHQKYAGLPTVVNATRNVSIKGLSADRRGWLQFDKTSNTKICDVEFEHLGVDGATTESLIFNVKPGGSFLLSGCYLDGSSSPASIKATTFYKKSYNIDIRDNVFYKYTDSALSLNNVINGIKIKNNLILRSGNHGVSLLNATIEGDIDITDNISLGNTGDGLSLENAGGNISGWVNWMNTKKGASIVSTTKGEAKDLTDEDIVVAESSTSVVIAYDSPFIAAYPDEYSTDFNGTLSWEAADKYSFKEDLTFEAFFKFNYAGTLFNNQIFVCGKSGIGSFSLRYAHGTRVFELWTNEATNTRKLQVTLPEYLIGWNHIALCRKNGVFGIFVNGVNVGTYTSFFEFLGTSDGINSGNFANSTNRKLIYGYRALTRAEYDPSLPTCTVPTAPFVVDNDTVMLYRRSIKSGSTNIQNIQNYYNQEGGMYIDNTLPSLKRTLIKNISSLNNVTYGFSLDGANDDYREANSLTATDIYAINNTGKGLVMNNMTGLLTGIYAANNSTTNIEMSLGDGITTIKSVTGLTNNAGNVNMAILNSKSLRPVIFDDIVLDKSSSFVGNYTGTPLRLGNTEFLNFHFDNSTLNTVSTGFAVTLSGTVLGTYQFSNTVTTDAGVQNLSCLPPDNIKSGGIIFMNKNKNKGSHESFYRKGKRATDTSVVAGNIAEKITPSSLTDRFKSGSKFAAVSSGDTVTLRMKVTTTVNGDARLMLKKNSSLGFDDDVLLYPISNSSTFTTTSPSASGVGIMEFFVDCTGTTGSVIIDDWKAK